MLEGEIHLEGFRRLRARQNRIEELEGIKWLRQAETREERQEVWVQYGEALRRYFAKRIPIDKAN